MVITHNSLYEFYAELWNSAQQTGGNSRYLRALDCWLMHKENLPEYMLSEYKRGRIIIYPKFPEYCCQKMECPEPKRIDITKKPSKLKRIWNIITGEQK